jgi:hypothetical protein
MAYILVVAAVYAVLIPAVLVLGVSGWAWLFLLAAPYFIALTVALLLSRNSRR